MINLIKDEIKLSWMNFVDIELLKNGWIFIYDDKSFMDENLFVDENLSWMKI